MNEGIKTMLGEVATVIGNCACIDNGLMLNKEAFETVKFPELNEDEREYYERIKRLKNGDKKGMVSFVNFDAMAPDWTFSYDDYYKILEAIIKGGYNE